jgi:hypothetical protein
LAGQAVPLGGTLSASVFVVHSAFPIAPIAGWDTMLALSC